MFGDRSRAHGFGADFSKKYGPEFGHHIVVSDATLRGPRNYQSRNGRQCRLEHHRLSHPLVRYSRMRGGKIGLYNPFCIPWDSTELRAGI